MPITRPCRSISGTVEMADGLPGLRMYRDVRYVPEGGPDDWGLYAGDTRIRHDAPPDDDQGSGPGLPIDAIPQGQACIYIGLLVLHYGHFVIDTLSRLWPLLAATGERPRIVCHRLAAYPEDRSHDFLYDMLAAIGVGRADIVSYDRETPMPCVVVPERSFHERRRVHPVFGDLCRRVGAGHWRNAAVDADARPAYLSKTRVASGMTRLVNEDRLEAELDRLGAEIVYPETLSFSEQVALFARRRFILGPTSSAFHTAAFSAPGRRILGLNWSYQLNANFPLFDAVNDTRAHYYWALGTRYAAADGFNAGWTIPEPERVARELLERVADFDRLAERDRRQDLDIARGERRIGPLLRRLRRRLTGWSAKDGRPSGT